MKKLIGYIIVFFPVIAIFGYCLWADWRETIYIVSGIVLLLDGLGWIRWFYALGKMVGNLDI